MKNTLTSTFQDRKSSDYEHRYQTEFLKPDVGNSLMGLEQKQKPLVLLGLFKTVLSICTPEKIANHSQHKMSHDSTSWNLTLLRWTIASAT